MKFYFAISGKMIEEHGMPESMTGGFHWDLKGKDKFLYSCLASSCGEMLDLMNKYNKDKSDELGICEAFIEDRFAINAIQAMLTGDSCDCPVKITEITWLKKQ